ncbi:hypothetical protein MMC28_008448 [Mycoblastus sanguinarius]|nr:hypothetical protein [Mycoblastus sanguinarius]
MSDSNRPINPSQLSHNLPGIQRHITTHDTTGLAKIYTSTPGQWSSLFNDTIALNVGYTTSFPPQMTSDADILDHEYVLSKGHLGLTKPNGTVCRFVDFSPGHKPVMHRTQSLDYGVVIEGEMELILDSGEKRIMGRGDLAVQRATNHAWRNTSETEWARMFFVLQASEKVLVGGKELGEDLSAAGEEKEALRQKEKGQREGK